MRRRNPVGSGFLAASEPHPYPGSAFCWSGRLCAAGKLPRGRDSPEVCPFSPWAVPGGNRRLLGSHLSLTCQSGKTRALVYL